MNNYNFAASNFPKDDYALTVLSHSAMHNVDRRSTEETNSLAFDSERHTRNGRNVTAEAGTTSLSNHPVNLHGINESSQDRIRNPNLLSDYNSGLLSSRDMDTLTFNPSMGQGQNPYSTRSYQGIGSQISQNYANSLGILSAESYDDGRGSLRQRDAAEMRARMRNEKTMPFGVEHPLPRIGLENQGTASEEDIAGKGRRKKRKDDSDEDDEARKKARGRPRVDTKDETAADRRRTQIRMAQRAYRHRKETTISSLEKQVQDLRGTNEEMSNIFINLYDFAIAKGLLQREPEFGQQLQSTTERFLALAKTTQDETHHDSAHEDSKHDEVETTRPAKGRRASPKKQQEVTQTTTDSTPSWGGYTLSKDDSPAEEIDMGFQDNQGYRRNDDVQVITRPTEDNASFPFDLMDLQTYRVEVPEIEDFSLNFFPESQLPLPNSHNYNEFSFARRIHRGAAERAFRLITSDDPAEVARRDQVFGLCLLYESKEDIEARLRRLVSRSTKESLHEWRAPFVHVGGAGTYYPVHDGDLSGDLMPKFRTAYSMGPFSPEVSKVAEIMDDDMRCKLPGFEGEFFDPNDVEGYLRGRGLDIPPAAEYVTGELDLAGLAEVSSPKSASSESVPSLGSPKTPRSPIGSLVIDIDRDMIASNLDFPRSDIDPSKAQNCLTFPIGFTNWDSDTTKGNDNFIDPIFDTMSTQNSTKLTPDFTMSGRTYGERQRVTLNVKTLLDELLSRGVCLGRSPGFRPADVNAAIMAAVRAGF